MTHLNITAAATCIAALFAAGTAQAEVTAQQVWDNWQESMAIYGAGSTISIGSESVIGPSISVSDLTMTIAEDGSTMTSTIPSIVFTELGDGTVQVVMSESYPITFEGAPGETATITVTQTGMEMIVSGTPDAIAYDFSATRLAVSVDEIRDRDEILPAEILFAMNTVSGSYSTSYGDLNVISYDMSVGGVDMLIDIVDPVEDLTVNFSGQMMEVALGGEITFPAEMDVDAPETMFVDGFAVDAGYGFGQSAFLFSFADGIDTGSGTISLGGGELGLGMNYDGIVYSNLLSDLAIAAEGSSLPFPVEVSLGEYALAFDMPLSRTDAPEPFSAEFVLADLVVGDMIWSMGDPGGILPRDPATAIIALSGSGSLLFDLLDPAQATQIAQAEMPGTLDSLSLDELTVRIAGAEVLGAGSFTFDNTDTITFDGLPRPEGELNIAVNGANGLIDKLVQMGLVPEDQVMGARMMLGMIAIPAGEDMLTSKIEVNDQGHVLANGQRMR